MFVLGPFAGDGGPIGVGIEHRPTKLNIRWTNGQVERMSRSIKEATLKRFCYEGRDQLRDGN